MAGGLNGVRWFIVVVSIIIGLVSLANQLSGNEPIEFGVPIISMAIGIVALVLGPAFQAFSGGGSGEDHGTDVSAGSESSDDH